MDRRKEKAQEGVVIEDLLGLDIQRRMSSGNWQWGQK